MTTPITAFYGGLIAFVYLYLSILVIRGRRKHKVGLGDGGDRHFEQLIRAHANYSEYVPITLILLLNAEINNGHAGWLHAAGILILFGRILHAYGLRHHYGASWQRVSGTLMTFAAIVVTAVINLLIFYI